MNFSEQILNYKPWKHFHCINFC